MAIGEYLIGNTNEPLLRRTIKPERESAVARRSHHYGILRTKDYTPEVKIAFSKTKAALRLMVLRPVMQIIYCHLGKDSWP